jgi:hypothetical protein
VLAFKPEWSREVDWHPYYFTEENETSVDQPTCPILCIRKTAKVKLEPRYV